ncbi:hypothetical protein H6G81_35070 [Scytonema hofmannii FACHB-248]|uniref:Uncharacterized protein n=1 Tax=Scytonema hofmannii FACHB-248 TaxID=1842502 RepID=A0ABR8H1X6_9CYAN|nr:hypothetical protein [Scytonema hofmannii]MBD2609574.1 hypothetical protein [Scytonema hofmannii FACHB-248]
MLGLFSFWALGIGTRSHFQRRRTHQFDQEFGFFKCETCSRVWASDEDDPDYSELMDDEPA